MLTEHRKLRLKTVDNQMIGVEVNYSKSPKVKDCKMIKLGIDGKEYEVERKELMSLMLIIGDKEVQSKLLPIKVEKIRKYETVLGFDFTASKDYKKGDKISVSAPYIVSIPETEEMFAGNLKLGA